MTDLFGENAKKQLIAAIIENMEANHISLAELEEVMAERNAGRRRVTVPLGDVAARLFASLGGIFVFAGIVIYAHTFWPEMNSMMRVLVTLGAGIVIQLLAVLALHTGRYARAVQQLLVIAVLLQTAGWFVALDALFPQARDAHMAMLFVCAVMGAQQALIFFYHRLNLLLLWVLCYGYGFLYVLLDLLEANEKIMFVGLGISMMAMAHFLRKVSYPSLSAAGFFIGGSLFYLGFFELVRQSFWECLYIAAVGGLVYVSIWIRSGTLLAVSTLAMLSYIGYFTAEHFVHSVGWPLALVMLGVAFFMVSDMALRVKRRFFA